MPISWSLVPLLALSSAPASEDDARRWDVAEVAFAVEAADLLPRGAVLDAFELAADAWNLADRGPLLLLERPPARAAAPAFDGENAVLFARERWDHDPRQLALTFVHLDSRTRTILEADILVNAVDHAWSVDAKDRGEAYDLQNVLTHELGHALGLQHLDEAPDATMYPDIRPSEVSKRDLALVDTEVLAALYDGFAPPAADARGCAQASDAAPTAALLPLLAALGSPRRRRSS